MALVKLGNGDIQACKEVLRLTLLRLWTVFEMPEQRRVPILLLTSYLLTSLAHCPAKALGLLQTVQLNISQTQSEDKTLTLLKYLLERRVAAADFCMKVLPADIMAATF